MFWFFIGLSKNLKIIIVSHLKFVWALSIHNEEKFLSLIRQSYNKFLFICSQSNLWITRIMSIITNPNLFFIISLKTTMNPHIGRRLLLRQKSNKKKWIDIIVFLIYKCLNKIICLIKEIIKMKKIKFKVCKILYILICIILL